MTTHYFRDITLNLPTDPMDLVLISNDHAITGARFGHSTGHPVWLKNAEPAGDDREPLATAARQLAEYATGERQVFDLRLELAGTEFQKDVWAELLQIPYGRTTTYGTVAAAIGRPGRARAVGAAVGSNPVGIIVPCHRVIGANGSLTGFAGGLTNKASLLSREGITAL